MNQGAKETAATIYLYADDKTRRRILDTYRLTWGQLLEAQRKGTDEGQHLHGAPDATIRHQRNRGETRSPNHQNTQP